MTVGYYVAFSCLFMFAMGEADIAGGRCSDGGASETDTSRASALLQAAVQPGQQHVALQEEDDGCEGWCDADYCGWEGGSTCGQCSFCVGDSSSAAPTSTAAPATTAASTPTKGCEDWCDADYCAWEGGSTCGRCAFCPPTPAPTPPTPRPPAIFGDTCDARYVRLETQLHNQAAFEPGADPQFPPDMRSIAEEGESCGDTAQGIKKSCEQYNQWKTFQEVAKVGASDALKVIGPSGVQYTDVGQGQLGTCYFLATIASVAYNQPKMIEDMFPAEFKDLYAQNIYTTRWWLNGKEHLITVDNQVPAADEPMFTGLSPTGEFWPLILEKTWAKMYGNYKYQEGGRFDEVMLAITRAPTRTIKDIKTDTESVWAAMVEAAKNKSPQAAWCKTGMYGLSGSHVYAVLTVEERATGRAVKVYNPWRADNYAGSLDASDDVDGDGTFWMTLNEFQQAFEWYWISQAIPNYRTVGYQAIPGNKAMTVSMTVPSEKKFIVCLNWPKSRILQGASCKDHFYLYEQSLSVCKDNGAGECTEGSVVASKDMEAGGGGLRYATIDSGGGTYLATVTSEYANKDKFAFIEELSVTVYSDGEGGAVQMTATEAPTTAAAGSVVGSAPTSAAAPATTAASTPTEGCEGWCDANYCGWEGGSTCGQCSFCV